MIPDDVRPLLQSLVDRSKKREVEWYASSATPHRQGDYVVLFPNASLTLSEEDENSRIEGKILNARGDVALTFWASYRDNDSADYTLLSELFELARRKVVKADEALAEIRSVLETASRVGEAPPKTIPKPTDAMDDDEEVPF